MLEIKTLNIMSYGETPYLEMGCKVSLECCIPVFLD